MAGNWWRCKIISEVKSHYWLRRGKFFIKNCGDSAILFDGRKKVEIPKTAMKNIKLLSRLEPLEAENVEKEYQLRWNYPLKMS